MAASQLCTYASLSSPELRVWSDRLRPMWDPSGEDPKEFVPHRKMWEWLFVCHALDERGLFAPGRRGLGFGVGREPLVALFAELGCTVVATDLDPAAAGEAGWTAGNQQHADGLAGLNEHGLCDRGRFAQLVTYRDVDMRALPSDLLDGGFDFTWSSCAFEHLGTLEAGMEFVVEQMRALRPGGRAVHTTEFNLSSDVETVAEGGTVLFRRRDIDGLVRRLEGLGYRAGGDFTPGDSPEDRHVDVPPFGAVHLRTMVAAYVTTSAALVVDKPTDWVPRRSLRDRLLPRAR